MVGVDKLLTAKKNELNAELKKFYLAGAGISK